MASRSWFIDALPRLFQEGCHCETVDTPLRTRLSPRNPRWTPCETRNRLRRSFVAADPDETPRNRAIKKVHPRAFGAGGGSRTLTGRKPHGILSRTRLPITTDHKQTVERFRWSPPESFE